MKLTSILGEQEQEGGGANGKGRGAQAAAPCYIHAFGHFDQNAPAVTHTLESP